VALDRVDDVGANRRALLDEGVASRTGQGLGMPAQPDTPCKNEQDAGDDQCDSHPDDESSGGPREPKRAGNGGA
jgi:hypothetical protein